MLPLLARLRRGGALIQLFTSRWANRELAHLACQPVGISRGNPRWPLPFTYRRLIELAPSREAFGLEDRDAFDAAYRAQLDALGIEPIMGKLEKISRESGGLPPVLLCFEADPADCHRGIAARWIRERGVEIRELAPGDLPERPGTPQLKLFG